MTKLVSLQDKPATKEDVGKVVYYANGVPCKITQCMFTDEILVDEAAQDDYDFHPADYYWQKPKIINEQSHEEMKQLIKEGVEMARFIKSQYSQYSSSSNPNNRYNTSDLYIKRAGGFVE